MLKGKFIIKKNCDPIERVSNDVQMAIEWLEEMFEKYDITAENEIVLSDILDTGLIGFFYDTLRRVGIEKYRNGELDEVEIKDYLKEVDEGAIKTLMEIVNADKNKCKNPYH